MLENIMVKDSPKIVPTASKLQSSTTEVASASEMSSMSLKRLAHCCDEKKSMHTREYCRRHTSQELYPFDNELRCPEVMTVNGRDWQLMGSIYSTKEWGCHFYAINRTNVVPLSGFYVYNDLVNNGRAWFHSLNLEE